MHKASRDSTLNGKSLTGMLTEWQLSSKYPSSSSTQPEGMLDQQRCLPRGGGGYSIFSAYVGSDPASTVHPPKNIRNFKHPKKIFEFFFALEDKNGGCLYFVMSSVS